MSARYDVIQTAQVSDDRGEVLLEVFYLPHNNDSLPVWIGLNVGGRRLSLNLSLIEAQQLAAGLHEVIAAKLQPTTTGALNV